MIATTRPKPRHPVDAVAYYRMSDDKQEASIPAQREQVEKYAASNGYRIVRTYADEGISGDATDKRKQFQRMIADAERGEFKAILCWDMDRFGRFDSIEAGRWIYPLRQADVHLATVAQGFIDWNDFAARMLYGIQTEAKHQYLVDLSRNVRRGLHRLAEQGLWASGKPPLGYAAVDKRLVLGPTEDVAFVRRMFADYLGGKSLRQMATEYLAEQITSPKGKRWTANGIAGVLKNPLYVGDFVWNRRSMSKYIRKGRKAKANSEAEWITVENHHEPIIDRESFAKVQAQLKARKNASTPHPNGGGFVLSGVLVCAECGHKMIGDLHNAKHHYTCYGYRQRGPEFCGRNCLRQTEILDGVLGAIEREYFNPKTLERLAAACRRKLEGKTAKPDSDKLRAELADLDAKLAKAKRRLVEVDRDLLDVVQEQVRDLKAKRDAAAARVKAAKVTPASRTEVIDAKLKAALAWFGRLREAAAKSDAPTLRTFIREAFEKIEIRTVREPWTAKRFKYRLAGGTITMRVDNLSEMPRKFWPCSVRSEGPCSGIGGSGRCDSRRGRG